MAAHANPASGKEPLELYPDRWRLGFFLVLGLGFVALGVTLLLAKPDDAADAKKVHDTMISAGVMAAMGAVVVACFLGEFLTPVPKVIADADGIHDRRRFFQKPMVPWSQITALGRCRVGRNQSGLGIWKHRAAPRDGGGMLDALRDKLDLPDVRISVFAGRKKIDAFAAEAAARFGVGHRPL